jgi:hypothetical protein
MAAPANFLAVRSAVEGLDCTLVGVVTDLESSEDIALEVMTAGVDTALSGDSAAALASGESRGLATFPPGSACLGCAET